MRLQAAAPKALIVTTVHWPATTRLGLALINAGFTVAAVAVADHGLRQLRRLDAFFACKPHVRTAATIRRAIERWMPDLVVPGDDPALRCLHAIHADAKLREGSRAAILAQLIETSLGNPAHFGLVEQRSAIVDLAVADGLRVPDSTVLTGVADLKARLAGATFPKVLKSDGSWGGLGVRIVRSPEEAERAYRELASPPKWTRVAKHLLQGFDVGPLRARLVRQRPAVTLQDYVGGRPANSAVACWKGEVLAGVSVEVLQTGVETGPSTVVRVIDHPEMAHATAHLVRRLELSGFCGVDFMLDEAGRAYLLEINPRTTQICHLALGEGGDMAGTLHACLIGGPPRRIAPLGCDVIALFPQEYWRDPASSYLFSAHHDVPWDAPEFIRAYLEPPAPPWIDALQQRLRRRRGPRAAGRRLGTISIKQGSSG